MPQEQGSRAVSHVPFAALRRALLGCQRCHAGSVESLNMPRAARRFSSRASSTSICLDLESAIIAASNTPRRLRDDPVSRFSCRLVTYDPADRGRDPWRRDYARHASAMPRSRHRRTGNRSLRRDQQRFLCCDRASRGSATTAPGDSSLRALRQSFPDAFAGQQRRDVSSADQCSGDESALMSSGLASHL